MNNTLSVNQLSPDGFSRFYFLADILLQSYKNSEKIVNILDVGGSSEYFEQILEGSGLRFKLTVLDILPKPEEMKSSYIQADATAMTLGDDSFDVVVSTDVIEHIPQEQKGDFVSECLRVSSDLCIIAGPFDTPGVHSAEVVVNAFNKRLFGVGQDWLEEHFRFDKPSIEFFEKLLHEKNIAYDHFGTQNLTTWLLNTHINLIDAKLGLNSSEHHKVNAFYDEHILCMNETTGPTYRHFFIAYKNPNRQNTIDLDRYINNEVDHTKHSAYISSLMELVTNRIEEMKFKNENLERELFESQNERVTAAACIAELRMIIHQQTGKLSPLNKE